MVIYDLAELQQAPESALPALQADSSSPALSTSQTPSSRHNSELGNLWSDDEMKVMDPRQGDRGASSNYHSDGDTTSNSSPDENFSNTNEAMPTPEPGSLFLLGSGLVAGARFVRRRRHRNPKSE